MGRVYDVNEMVRRGTFGTGFRVLSRWGVDLGPVTRVEFDGDADCGAATVTRFVADVEGTIQTTPDLREPARTTFRVWCRVEMRPVADGAGVRPEDVPPAVAAGV